MKATEVLHERGQSLWLDNITRSMLDDGTLRKYIYSCSVTGLTSNPSIFDKAIGSGYYDDAIRAKAGQGLSAEQLFFELAIEDLRRAADLFLPVHERTDGVDDRRLRREPMRNLHRKCLSEPDRLMPEEHQSSQLRGHFPHPDTHTGIKFIHGFTLSQADGFGSDISSPVTRWRFRVQALTPVTSTWLIYVKVPDIGSPSCQPAAVARQL